VENVRFAIQEMAVFRVLNANVHDMFLCVKRQMRLGSTFLADHLRFPAN
jgi:hypothetical protein